MIVSTAHRSITPAYRVTVETEEPPPTIMLPPLYRWRGEVRSLGDYVPITKWNWESSEDWATANAMAWLRETERQP